MIAAVLQASVVRDYNVTCVSGKREVTQQVLQTTLTCTCTATTMFLTIVQQRQHVIGRTDRVHKQENNSMHTKAKSRQNYLHTNCSFFLNTSDLKLWHIWRCYY